MFSSLEFISGDIYPNWQYSGREQNDSKLQDQTPYIVAKKSANKILKSRFFDAR